MLSLNNIRNKFIMKKTLSIIFAFTTLMSAMGQTFVVTNADGKDLKYTVANASAQTVNLVANNYRGHIVVPEQVEYEEVTYTVVGIGTSFKNSPNLNYLELPQTVTTFDYQSFQNARRLDTLVSHSVAPIVPSYGTGDPRQLFTSRLSAEPMMVVVPCGSLHIWRAGWWGVMPGLRSDCAVYLAIQATADSVIRFDSVIVNNRPYYSSGWYEIGDTAKIIAEQFTWRLNGATFHKYGARLLGWSTGDEGLRFEYLVTGPDTLTAYCIVMAHNALALDIISADFISVYGNIGFDGNTSQSPTIFQTGLWIGNGTHLAAVRFMNDGCDYTPGPLRLADAQTDIATTMQFNRVWHISRSMIDNHIAHCDDTGYMPVDDIASWPGNGPEGYAAQLAPFYDADSDGSYNPLAGDYPLIRGDECTFSIFNDNLLPHTESGGQPFGIEVHCMTYGFNEPDSAIANTIFAHFDIYNRTADSYSNVYLGAFTDFDIGYAADDYIGCDVQRNMYYGYNGNPDDMGGIWTGAPPAQSCTFLGGPMDNSDQRLMMTNFTYYDNANGGRNGEPSSPADYYNYMRSLWRDSTHITYGGSGLAGTIPCTHMFPWDSDPSHTSTDGIDPGFLWAEHLEGNPPGDRRGIGASGPCTFQPYGVQQLDIAYTTAFGTDNVNSVRTLASATDNVRCQWLRDTTDSGRPFTYMPYSAPHPIAVDRVPDGDPLRIFPNPTDGQLHIIAQDADWKVDLFDIFGRRLHVTVQHNTIDLSPLPCGTYLVRVTHAGSVAVRHVVKR